MIIKGVRYHFRTCVICGETFYTRAKYCKNGFKCAECAEGKANTAIPKKEWKLIINQTKSQED